MRYMLLIYGNEAVLDADQRNSCYGESAALARDLAAEGVYRDASPLHSISAATSVRVREGKRMVTDGPFAEIREQLGGYYIVETENLDEAIAVAGRIPGARWGTVEIRPILEIPGLPEENGIQ